LNASEEKVRIVSVLTKIKYVKFSKGWKHNLPISILLKKWLNSSRLLTLMDKRKLALMKLNKLLTSLLMTTKKQRLLLKLPTNKRKSSALAEPCKSKIWLIKKN
jgi:hypothetical protein